MRTDLWGWFNRYAAQAYLEAHPLKQAMVQVYDMGWQALRAERPEDALGHFAEGFEIAQQLNQPCWELFFDYWSTETLVFYQSNYHLGLDRAIKMGARAHQDRYLSCPVRARAYYTLMYVYFAMDAVGYADKVRETIAFMEREIPLDDDTHHRMQYTRSSLAFALEDYELCEQEIQHYLSITIGNPHRQSGGYNTLYRIAYARGNLQDAFNHLYQSEKNARHASLQNSVANALLSQAICAIRLGQTERAAELHQQGLAHYQRFNIKQLPSYYNAVCEYLELAGETEEVIHLREKELSNINEFGSIDYTAYAHLEYCRLLGRLSKDIVDALQASYQAASKLLKPQLFLDKLKQLEAGNYYKYDWQNPNSEKESA
jgi:tetratricopeptide (TPR) repeat protein